MPYNPQGMNPQMLLLVSDFQKAYPNVQLTSGYRDRTYNARVGGKPGSQHIHGNATDFSLAGLTPGQQLDVLNWWKNAGATGFGYYPGSQSAHVDIRQGPVRFWGPNGSRDTIGQTPEWFQTFAGGAPGGSPVPAFARGQGSDGGFGLENIPGGGGEVAATPPVDPGQTQAAKASAAQLGQTGMQMIQQNQGGKQMVDPALVGMSPVESRPQVQPLPNPYKKRVIPVKGYFQQSPLRFQTPPVGGLLDG